MEIKNINLNFLDNYYMFYEWLNNDDIREYKNIKIIRVSQNTIKDFINYEIKDININDGIYIFTDTFSYVAIEFKNKESTFKSSLSLKDEMFLNEKVDNLKKENIKYKKGNFLKNDNELRVNELAKKTIVTEIKNLKNNPEKLKYLYYEWFKKEDSDIIKMVEKMNNKLYKPLTKKELYIYELIKRSYKMV